ncbi:MULTISPECIES: hypothetical protein [Luteimonas]|uniref:hypothetical protein n=1 Tax=Luteimonas TaxID=83614 RepID=UPI000F4E9CDA|nr:MULTISPECIES: hypothetical protein [Luteimonas]RPD88558.1 hypothetical protein EGK76_05310 [Luteimonas sp. 100069]
MNGHAALDAFIEYKHIALNPRLAGPPMRSPLPSRSTWDSSARHDSHLTTKSTFHYSRNDPKPHTDQVLSPEIAPLIVID